MSQSVMNGKTRRPDAVFACLCFAALLALHGAAFFAAGFFARGTALPEPGQKLPLAFDLVLRETVSAHNEAAPAPERPPEPAGDLSDTAEAPAVTTGAETGTAETTGEVPAAAAGDQAAFAAAEVSAETPAPALPDPKDYLALVMRRLEEKKVYPLAMRKRGIQGDMPVQFTIKRDGTLAQLVCGDSRAHPFLVQAAAETVKSASPFPVMDGIEGDFLVQVTIRYQLE